MVCLINNVPLLRNRTFVMKSATEKLGEVPRKTCQIPPPLKKYFIHLTASVIESGAVKKWLFLIHLELRRTTDVKDCQGNVGVVGLLQNVPPSVLLVAR